MSRTDAQNGLDFHFNLYDRYDHNNRNLALHWRFHVAIMSAGTIAAKIASVNGPYQCNNLCSLQGPVV
jgi:hypothetical protein